MRAVVVNQEEMQLQVQHEMEGLSFLIDVARMTFYLVDERALVARNWSCTVD